MPKYYEEGATPATFAQLREAYLMLGLTVQELPLTYSSSPVRYVHDGVPYTLDCHHALEDVPTKAAKLYVLLERHHSDIKRLYEAWQSICEDELTVLSGGGLQLQAFFSAGRRYQGILGLSHIDDGRFSAVEAMLREQGLPFTPYAPAELPISGPYTLMLDEPWLSKLPDVSNIRVRCAKTQQYRTPLDQA